MRILFDSSIWVSYFHLHDVNHQTANLLISNALAGRAEIVVPEIVYIEVMNAVWRLSGDKRSVERCKRVFQHGKPFIRLVRGDESFWFSAIEEIMEKVSLRASDLIIVAYAISYRVDRFETFDRMLQREKSKLHTPL